MKRSLFHQHNNLVMTWYYTPKMAIQIFLHPFSGMLYVGGGKEGKTNESAWLYFHSPPMPPPPKKKLTIILRELSTPLPYKTTQLVRWKKHHITNVFDSCQITPFQPQLGKFLSFWGGLVAGIGGLPCWIVISYSLLWLISKTPPTPNIPPLRNHKVFVFSGQKMKGS